MASQQPGHNQEQPYQAYQGHQPEHAQQPQSGPGINAPLLQFSESTGRYEAPPSTHAGQGQYGSGHPPGEGFGSGGFGGEHEAGYQIPANTQHGAQHGDVHGSGFGEQHSSGFGSDHHQPGHEAPPGLPPRRTDTGAALPQGQDRSHQVEVMQSYEMSRPQTEDERNQSILQREFPKMDSSLIAAIYSDSGSLSATREMLQELGGGEAQ